MEKTLAYFGNTDMNVREFLEHLYGKDTGLFWQHWKRYLLKDPSFHIK